MAEKIIPVEKLTYEQAFDQLEAVVEALETGQSSLEESLGLFERGQALARRCAELLDQAELRIQTLTTQEPDLPAEEDDQA
jgi:exodeoxyribonuclease VII small subunit